MTNPISTPTSAFNVERMRERMYRNVAVPDDFLQKAVDTTYKKLTAKKTQFFSHMGEVKSVIELEDHVTQLAAADQVYKLSSLYARERDAAPGQPTIALEMNPQTGVVRLVIGALPEVSRPGDVIEIPVLPPVVECLPTTHVDMSPSGTTPQQEEDQPPQVVKVRPGNLPPDVFKALFED